MSNSRAAARRRARHSATGAVLAVAADQLVGRAVVGELGVALELGDDRLRQHLAELDPPLVEGVDAPDRALGEDPVLVERDEAAERAAGQPLGEDRVRRPVALEDAVGRLCPRRVALAEGERLGLGEDVGDQQVVVVAERVQRLVEADQVARDQLRPLVDQLVEGVLAVGPRLAPVDGAGLVVDPARRRGSRACRSTPSSAAGGRRESASGTARRAARRPSGRRRSRRTRPRAGPSAPAGSRPSAPRRKCSSTAWKPASISAKRLGPDREHRREPDRRVHRVAAAHPLPEAEHVVGVDPELRHALGVGRDGDEVLGDRRLVAAEPGERPLARGVGVGHRLQRRERLRARR